MGVEAGLSRGESQDKGGWQVRESDSRDPSPPSPGSLPSPLPLTCQVSAQIHGILSLSVSLSSLSSVDKLHISWCNCLTFLPVSRLKTPLG